MAKQKVNKSQAIRDYVAGHPNAPAKDVVAALAKKKISVSAGTVATVKSKAGLSKSRRPTAGKKRPAKSKEKLSANGSSLSVDILLEAKKFCVKAGSLESAQEAIRALKQLDAIS